MFKSELCFKKRDQAMVGQRVREQAPLTKNMSAILYGSAGLKVEALSTVKQNVSISGITTWQWTVTPLRLGNEILTLILSRHLNANEEISLPSFEDDIKVRITQWQYIKDGVAELNPVWSFTATVIPVLAGLFFWFRNSNWRKQEKPKPKPKPPLRRPGPPPRVPRPTRQAKR